MPRKTPRRPVESQGLLLPPKAGSSALTAGIDEAGAAAWPGLW